MKKRLHEAKLSGIGSNPAVNEIHLQPRAERRAREGAVDRRSKASLTHLPCNPLEQRTTSMNRFVKAVHVFHDVAFDALVRLSPKKHYQAGHLMNT